MARSALLAQLVEHLHGKEGVDGSSPSEGFKKIPAKALFLKGSKMLDHAAARWYSWMSPPSRSRRLISPRLGGGSALVESGVSSASPRWGRSQL